MGNRCSIPSIIHTLGRFRQSVERWNRGDLNHENTKRLKRENAKAAKYAKRKGRKKRREQIIFVFKVWLQDQRVVIMYSWRYSWSAWPWIGRPRISPRIHECAPARRAAAPKRNLRR